jgi:hypothetical protein
VIQRQGDGFPLDHAYRLQTASINASVTTQQGL